MLHSIPSFCGIPAFSALCLSTLLAIMAAGCASVLSMPREVMPGQALSIINANRKNADFVLLDVRTPKEYEEGHIPGALNIDFNSASFRPDIDKLDRKKTYLIYCRSGNRSGQALDVMKEMGFPRTAHIAGGINAWRQAGQRIIVGLDMGKR